MSSIQEIKTKKYEPEHLNVRINLGFFFLIIVSVWSQNDKHSFSFFFFLFSFFFFLFSFFFFLFSFFFFLFSFFFFLFSFFFFLFSFFFFLFSFFFSLFSFFFFLFSKNSIKSSSSQRCIVVLDRKKLRKEMTKNLPKKIITKLPHFYQMFVFFSFLFKRTIQTYYLILPLLLFRTSKKKNLEIFDKHFFLPFLIPNRM